MQNVMNIFENEEKQFCAVWMEKKTWMKSRRKKSLQRYIQEKKINEKKSRKKNE
jgi:hypothetical protein